MLLKCLMSYPFVLLLSGWEWGCEELLEKLVNCLESHNLVVEEGLYLRVGSLYVILIKSEAGVVLWVEFYKRSHFFIAPLLLGVIGFLLMILFLFSIVCLHS